MPRKPTPDQVTDSDTSNEILRFDKGERFGYRERQTPKGSSDILKEVPDDAVSPFRTLILKSNWAGWTFRTPWPLTLQFGLSDSFGQVDRHASIPQVTTLRMKPTTLSELASRPVSVILSEMLLIQPFRLFRTF